MTDDELDAMLRAARPGTARRSDPLSERARRELAAFAAAEDGLVRSRPRRRRTARRWSPRAAPLLGAAAVAVVAIAVLTLSLLPRTPAAAVTPALLVETPVAATAGDLWERMAERVGDTAAAATIRSTSWALDTAIDADGEIVSSSVEPRITETTFGADGDIRSVVTAGTPFAGQDPAALTPPGTVLSDETVRESAQPAAVPADAAAIGVLLAEISGEDPVTAGTAFREVAGLLSTIRLDGTQEAAILRFLATREGVEVAGEVTDRLGRPGIAFRAVDRLPGEVEDLLIVSPDTGAILAVESVYVGAARPDIPSPAVIDYTAWNR